MSVLSLQHSRRRQNFLLIGSQPMQQNFWSRFHVFSLLPPSHSRFSLLLLCANSLELFPSSMQSSLSNRCEGSISQTQRRGLEVYPLPNTALRINLPTYGFTAPAAKLTIPFSSPCFNFSYPFYSLHFSFFLVLRISPPDQPCSIPSTILPSSSFIPLPRDRQEAFTRFI